MNIIKENLLAYIKFKGLKKSAFEKSIGVSNGYLNNIKGSIGDEKIEYLFKIYPDLNPEWLTKGNGSMLLGSEKSITISGNTHNVSSNNINSDIAVSELIHQLAKKDEQIDRLLSLLEKK